MRISPALIILAAIVILILVVILVIVGKRNSPSKERTDLSFYYNLSMDPGTNRAAAAGNEAAIVMGDAILNTRALIEDDHIYIPQTIIKNNIDSRYYYDNIEGVFVLTGAKRIIRAYKDDSAYYIDNEKVPVDYVVVKDRNGTGFIATDFLDQFSSATSVLYQDPIRVVVRYDTGEVSYCDVKSETQVRVSGGIKSPIVGTVSKGNKLQVISEEDKWIQVVSEEGWKGYVQASACSDIYTENVTSHYIEDEYTNKTLGETVRLGWHGVYTTGGNDYITDVLDVAGSLNVYAPTWYDIMDEDGTLRNLSSSESVDYAHSEGVQVWAVLSDPEVDSSIMEQVLNRTSIREEIINEVVEDVKAIGADGINVDFENILSASGDGYIEFIRELSVRCRNEGLFLSSDSYAPYEYNNCYHAADQAMVCDYVMIMMYDDYVGSGTAGPNSSLPFIKEVTELSLTKVGRSRLVAGLPFYSRFWYTDENGSLSREEVDMATTWERLEYVSYEWKDDLGLDYGYYYDDSGRAVEVWAESSDSIRAKLSMLKEYNIGGYAFWRLGQETASNWEVIGQY